MRKDVLNIGSYYEESLIQGGRIPRSVGYPNVPDLATRFEVLLEQIDWDSYTPQKRLKLLDLGCGPAFLLDYLAKNGLLDRIEYTGVDVTEATLVPARAQWPGYHFEIRDVRDRPFPVDTFDYCIACGVFTTRYGTSTAETRDLAEQSLRAIWPSVRLGLTFNTMSKHVDWEREDLLHWALDDIMAFCKRHLSRHVAFRLDYGPWETTISVLKAPVRRRSQVPPSWLLESSSEPESSHNQKVQDALVANSADDSVTGSPTFDYAPGRPNLYLLMRFKQALVASLGVPAGFDVYRRSLALPDSAYLTAMSLRGERAYAVARSQAFTEIVPGGLAFVLNPPSVIGEGNHRQLTGVTRSLYLACLADVGVRGRSAMIEAHGVALLDYQEEERDRLDDEIEWDPSIFSPTQADDDRIWVVVAHPAASIVKVEQAFSLLGAHTDFFGHWLCEYLPKYTAARLYGLSPDIPVLIDANMPVQHRQALELLFGEEIELIEVPAFAALRVEKLWSFPSLSYMPLHEKRNERFSWDAVAASPEHFTPIIREMSRRAGLLPATRLGSKKLYLARRPFRHRKLVNSYALETAAISRGFDIVYPEELTFGEQAKLILNAGCIVAPEGSAIFLGFFAVPGTRLCILSHPLTDALADYHGLFSMHGIQTTAITGPIVRLHSQTPHDSDYEIDIQTFEAFIDNWPISDS